MVKAVGLPSTYLAINGFSICCILFLIYTCAHGNFDELVQTSPVLALPCWSYLVLFRWLVIALYSIVQDLSRLGRDLAQVVIVDNSPASYIFHPENAVCIMITEMCVNV